jgi:hypothetical protein
MNAHANIIQKTLDEVYHRGRFERHEPLFILVETRKLIESEKLKSKFLTVNLYCDWCVHPQLDREGAANVLLKITAAVNKSFRNPSGASIDILYDGVCPAFAVRDLQKELVTLYSQYGVDTWHLSDAPRFRQFMGAILDIIADRPLCFPPDIASRTGKVRKIYDDVCRLAGNDAKLAVTQCLVTNVLSKEELAFYTVPEGTYTWQITTKAGVVWSGVLLA